jgi:hypothetical protein
MVRRIRVLVSALAGRPGATIVTIDRWSLAEELWSFGEDGLYLAPLQMPDDEMVRLWVLAGKLYWRGEAWSAGEAAALAAVTIIEDQPRPLARTRRRPQRQRPRFPQTHEERFC